VIVKTIDTPEGMEAAVLHTLQEVAEEWRRRPPQVQPDAEPHAGGRRGWHRRWIE
jgi:hypothetical protein